MAEATTVCFWRRRPPQIFCNLGRRRAGEATAYSIFADGYETLLGQLRADQIMAEIRGGAGAVRGDAPPPR